MNKEPQVILPLTLIYLLMITGLLLSVSDFLLVNVV